MTDEEVLVLPEVKGFMGNFAKWCGAPRAVFEGQFLVAVRAAQEATKERCAIVADKYAQRFQEQAQESENLKLRALMGAGHDAAKAIAETIRALAAR